MGRVYKEEDATVYALEEGEKIGQVSVPDIDSRAGYTTLFKPGRFEKRLEKRGCPESEGVIIRPYGEGDEGGLMRLFEEIYAPFFGWRKKDVARWDALRGESRERDPKFIFIAEDRRGIQGWAGAFRQWVGLVGELHVRPSRLMTCGESLRRKSYGFTYAGQLFSGRCCALHHRRSGAGGGALSH